MATTVGKLQVKLETNNRQLQSGLRQAGRSVDGFARRATRASKRVAAGFVAVRAAINSTAVAAGALIGVVAVGFLAKASRNAVQFADSIAKTADSVGITTELLQELRFVASQTGVSTQALEKAYKKLAQGIGEARKGSGLLITALRDTDPALLSTLLHAEGTENAFLEMLKAIRNTPDAIDKVGLAAAAFGARGGVALINMARLTDSEFQELIITARETGRVIGDELLRESEKLNDEFDKLSGAIGSKLKAAFIGLAPAVNTVTDLLNKNLDAFALLSGRAEEDLTKIPRRVLDVLGVEASTRTERARERVAADEARPFDRLNVTRQEANRAAGVRELTDALQRQVDLEGEIKRRDDDRAARAKIEKTITEDRLADIETEKELTAIQKEQAASLRILNAEEIAHGQATADAISAVDGRIFSLGQQILKIEELAVAEGDEVARVRILNRLREEQTRLMGGLAEAQRLVAERGPVTDTSAIAGGFVLPGQQVDATASDAAAGQRNQAMFDAEIAARELKTFGDNMAGTVTGGISRGLQDAFSGEGADFLQIFADTGADLFSASMETALATLQEKISETFQGLGEGLGSALGVGLGIGAQLLSGALQSTDKKITRSNVTSAVTSSQALRGVVAGPANIAIAQVAPAIDDAFEESRVIAKRGNFLLEEILAAVNRTSGGGGFGGFATADALGSQSLG